MKIKRFLDVFRRFLGILGLCSALLGMAAGAAVKVEHEFVMDSWETEQGLPENSATCFVQTPDGYLWFGTFNGLVRFDGMKFRVFNRSNTPDLVDNAVVNLHLDQAGRLWISTVSGLAFVRDGQWTQLGAEQGWTGNFVRCFAESPDGDLYLSSFDGLVAKFQNGAFESLNPPDAGSGGYVAYLDGENVLWAMNEGFLGRWVGGRWDPLLQGAEIPDVFGVGRARDGGMWIANNGELLKFRGREVESRDRIPFPIRGVWNVFEDSRGVVWICSFVDGLYQFSREGGWRHWSVENGLTDNSLRSAFEDREGSVWVGSSGGGMMRFKRKMVRSIGVEEGLPVRVVKTVAKGVGETMFLGTHGGGLIQWNGRDLNPIKNPFLKPTGELDYVTATITDRRGWVWVGRLKEGLDCLDSSDNYRVRERFLEHEAVSALFEDSAGRVWVGSSAGVLVYDQGSLKPVPVRSIDQAIEARCFVENPMNREIWIGARNGGLFRFENGALEKLPQTSELEQSTLLSLRFGDRGELWIGTEERGLACLMDGKVTWVNPWAVLGIRSIGCILEDGSGNLWMSSQGGIVRVPKAGLEHAVFEGAPHDSIPFEILTTADGLISRECAVGQQPSGGIGRDGKLWFATYRGAVQVDPYRLEPVSAAPSVWVEELVADGRQLISPVEAGGIHAPDQAPVLVPAGTRRLELRLAAVSLANPEKERVRYRVEGLDADWTEVGLRREVYLQNLAPGSHRVWIQVTDRENRWHGAAPALVMTVQPFVWQTLWFRTVTPLVLIGLVSGVSWRVTRHRWRRRLEELHHLRALQWEKMHRAAVLDSTSDFVCFLDRGGRALNLNPAGRRLIGLREDEPLEGGKSQSMHPEWAATLIRDHGIPEACRSGVWEGESALLTRDGREIPVSQVIVHYREPDGVGELLATICRDITAQKRHEVELAAARDAAIEVARLKSEFVATMSHEIRTPMNGVIGMTELLLETNLDPEQRSYAETVQFSADSLLVIINDILDFSKIEAGKLDIEMRDLDLNEVLEDVLGASAEPAGRKKLELAGCIGPGTPTLLRGDSGRLRQILTNLLGNAIKFTSTGEVVVRIHGVSESEHHAVIRCEVRDTGIGIAADKKKLLFEPFSQVDGSMTRRYGGSGLGLSISKRLVELMQGEVGVDSTPGRGSTFWFTAHLEKQPGEADRRGTLLEVPFSGSILVVDDNASSRAILHTRLQGMGLEVTEASSVAEAYSCLGRGASRSEPVSLVLLDYGMAGSDDLELVRRVRATPNLANLPIVLMARFGERVAREVLEKEKIVACLYKPIRDSALRDILGRLGGGDRARTGIQRETNPLVAR
ncbi:MAG: response regulator [Verrucomicrobia bacterium]|nr:response regulator [Verrucomicrobiota bacterium]